MWRTLRDLIWLAISRDSVPEACDGFQWHSATFVVGAQLLVLHVCLSKLRALNYLQGYVVSLLCCGFPMKPLLFAAGPPVFAVSVRREADAILCQLVHSVPVVDAEICK